MTDTEFHVTIITWFGRDLRKRTVRERLSARNTPFSGIRYSMTDTRAPCHDYHLVWQRIALDVRILVWFGRELRKRTVCERFFAGNTPYRTFSGSSGRENRTFPFISANSKGILCICLILCQKGDLSQLSITNLDQLP